MPGSYFTLDSLGETMLSFGNTYLDVEGNTDSRGNEAANKSLSQKRAEAVKAYLMKNFEIPAAPLHHRGQGLVEPGRRQQGRRRARAQPAHGHQGRLECPVRHRGLRLPRRLPRRLPSSSGARGTQTRAGEGGLAAAVRSSHAHRRRHGAAAVGWGRFCSRCCCGS